MERREIERLRAIAEAAPSDMAEYDITVEDENKGVYLQCRDSDLENLCGCLDECEDAEKALAAHIAEFDPPTCLAMLDEIERLKELLNHPETCDVLVSQARNNLLDKAEARAEAAEWKYKQLEELYGVAIRALEAPNERAEKAEAEVERLKEFEWMYKELCR